MRTGRAPRHRGVENWSKVVDSFTGTVDTLCTNAMKELKLFINSEIAGPGGPTKAFKGECPHHFGFHTLFAFSCGLLRFNCFLFYVQLSWVPAQGRTSASCITSGNGATVKVHSGYALHVSVCIECMCMYL